MAADSQKSQTPLTDAPDVAEYIARAVPFPAFQESAARATNTPKLGDMLEATEPKRWSDAPMVQRHPFEVYIKGQSSTGAMPTFLCAWGTIGYLTSATEAIAIANRTDDLALVVNDIVWLEVEFDENGTILSAELKYGVPAAGTWTNYPTLFETTSSGNKWFHPIAEVTEITTFESGFNTVNVDIVPYRIAQLERNHLRPVKMCNTDGSNFWMLTPGPGAPHA